MICLFALMIMFRYFVMIRATQITMIIFIQKLSLSDLSASSTPFLNIQEFNFTLYIVGGAEMIFLIGNESFFDRYFLLT